MELIGQVIGVAVEPVYNLAKRHINYVARVKESVEKLGDKGNELERKKRDLDSCVNEARRDGEDIKEEVDDWLVQVAKCLDDVNRFLDQEKGIASDNGSSFCQCCCFIPKHHKTGKEAETLTAKVTKMLEKAKEPCFSKVGVRSSAPPKALPRIAYSKEINSREILLENIIEAFKVKDIIGIHGMPGVGKTVLVNRLLVEVESRKLFDKVCIATVSRNPNMKKIRDVIADKILDHPNFHANSEEGRKDTLHAKLNKLKQQQTKVLLVLDDAWDILELHEIGVPCPLNEDFKIVVTSRFEDVCANMGDKKSFEVNVLDRQEAWSLFWRSLGDDYSENKDYKDVAEDMVNHFNGLPLAIVTLARALNKKKLPVWRAAAGYIRKKQLNEIDKMEKSVIGAFEFSFDYLNSKEQHIFLLCCLFPEDCVIVVDALVMYGISLGLFENDRLAYATDCVVSITETLKSRGLLLTGDDGPDGSVKMHDVTRDAALHIASKGEFDYLVKEDDEVRSSNLFSNDKLSKKRAISILTNTGIMEFVGHDKMGYPNLDILRLQCSPSTESNYPFPIPFRIEFSTCFFEGMTNLKILEIHEMKISSFSNSLGSLKNTLRTLCLYKCWVIDIAEVGELTHLEILDLTDSRICGGLYGAVQGLRGLRVLDLRSCLVNGLPDNFVGGLPNQLEGLYLLDAYITDDDEDELCPTGRRKPITASLEELELLTSLEMLGVAVVHLEQVTDKFLSIFSKLSSFNLLLFPGDYTALWGHSKVNAGPLRRILHLWGITMKKHLQQGLGLLIRGAKELYLSKCHDSPIMSQYYKDEFSNLTDLVIWNCNAAEDFVISGRTIKSAESRHDDGLTPFAKLEYLSVWYMGRLKAMCAPNQHIVLSKLEMLSICGCPLLRYVFTKSVAIQLQQLKTIEICGCSEMEEIFTSKDNNTSTGISSSEEGTNNYEIMDDTPIILPSLQEIKLDALPLKHFAGRNRCPPGARSTFFGEQVEFPELKMLRMERLRSCEEIWESHLPTGSFGQLRELSIANCDELRYIFSSAVARCLVHLQKLVITGCSKLEEVVVMESVDPNKREENKIKFPALHNLILFGLDNLHSFCSARNYVLEFPSLEKINIELNSNMQLFSYGPLDTPKLTGLNPLHGDDLNTFVARMYKEYKGLRRFESMRLDDGMDQNVLFGVQVPI